MTINENGANGCGCGRGGGDDEDNIINARKMYSTQDYGDSNLYATVKRAASVFVIGLFLG